MTDKVNITSGVLKWARLTAHMSLEAAASKVHVLPERLSEWESGNALPTLRQAEMLAKAYKRPFAVFFLPRPPHDFMPLQDFRRKTSAQLTTASIFIIREMQQRQAWARDFHEERGESPLPFVGRFTLHHAPEIVAKDILHELGINPLQYRQGSPMKEWIGRAETKGIFISRTSFIHSRLVLNSEEFQGFAISDIFAPFVFVNADDWDSAQLFSLVHELAHVWINQSGISSEILPENQLLSHQHPVELFCNQVAAAALLPADVVDDLSINTFDNISQVYLAARHYGVSSFALLIRALHFKKISLARYQELKNDADREFQIFLLREREKERKPKKKEGGPNPFVIKANRNGHLFTRFVLDAYRSGAIQPTEASSLLDTHVNHFNKLEAFV